MLLHDNSGYANAPQRYSYNYIACFVILTYEEFNNAKRRYDLNFSIYVGRQIVWLSKHRSKIILLSVSCEIPITIAPFYGLHYFDMKRSESDVTEPHKEEVINMMTVWSA